MSLLRTIRFRRRITALHAELGVPAAYRDNRHLPLHPEARELVAAGRDIYDREQRMAPGAEKAWRGMRLAAKEDGIELQLVSAFRSVRYQADIIRRKLEKGLTMDEILSVSAAPGFSEHHTGRALDLTTPGAAVLEETFEDSEAFRWLEGNAARFGFRLSYPRGNAAGVAYEPWHWAWSVHGA